MVFSSAFLHRGFAREQTEPKRKQGEPGACDLVGYRQALQEADSME